MEAALALDVVAVRKSRYFERNPQPRRALERTLRKRAVAFARCHLQNHSSLAVAADRLGLSLRTLQDWCKNWRDVQLDADPRGRRPKDAPTVDLNDLYFALEVLGPEVGLPFLYSLFPNLSRSTITRILVAYRRDCADGDFRVVSRLRWDNRGAVWAMDYTDPLCRIDGEHPYVLSVRDLGSGCGLAALPVPDQTTITLIPVLEALFARYGTPLVIKADNGSAFISNDLETFLWLRGVTLLLSPPGMPRFNGACEAGIGSLKTRAHHIAASNGRQTRWSADDIEAARLLGNASRIVTNGVVSTPDHLWSCRAPIDESDRGTFRRSVRILEVEVTKELGLLPGAVHDARSRACIERLAITRALVDLGHLTIRRQRLTQPISRRFRAMIA